MLVGHVDLVDRHEVFGWAADTSYPDATVEVLVFVNGTLGGRVAADMPREDIRALRIYGEGRLGFHFRFDFPVSLLRRYDIVVSFAATRVSLGGGRVTLPKQGIELTDDLRPVADDLRPVMVTSTGRSGTTMLMRRLGNNSAVVIGEMFPFEVKLVTYYAQAFEILTSPGNREKSVNTDLIFDDPYHVGSNPYYHYFFREVFPRQQMLNEFFSRQVPPVVAAAFKQIITAFYRKLTETQRKPGARFFAEKCDVFNTARDFARILYPNMREIILVRDPRDVFCSQRSFWSAPADSLIQALRSMRDRILEFRAEQAPNLMFVKYEDLVRAPQETMARIWTLLELEAVTEINAGAEEQQFKVHATSRDPGASIGRWRKELGEDELRQFDQEFDTYFDTFGYERSIAAPHVVAQAPASETAAIATPEPPPVPAATNRDPA